MSENTTHIISILIPGAVQGLCSCLVSYPFDTLKTQVQAKYTWESIREQVRRNPWSLFRGVHYPLLSAIPERSIQYGVYEIMMSSGNYSSITSSVVATLPSSLISTVASVYKIRQQLQLKGGTQVRSILFPIEISRNVLSGILFLWAYGSTRDRLGIGMASILSTAFYWSLTYPLCTMKTLLSTNRTMSILQCVRQERWYLWRGISLVYLRVIPTSLVSMYSYEWVRNKINN